MHWESKYTDTWPSPFPPADDSAGGKGEEKGGVTCWQLAPVWQVGAANLSSPLLPSRFSFPPFLLSLNKSHLFFLLFASIFSLFLSNSFRDLLHLPPSSETLAQADTLNPCGSACALTTEGIFNNKQSKRLSPECTHKHTHCVVTLLMHVSCCNPRRFDITISPRD